MTVIASDPARLIDLSRRSPHSEWLDNAEVHRAELAVYLRDLARFNGAMLGHWPVITWLGRAVKESPKDKPLTLLDVGCGYGDLLRAIRRWARKRGVAMRLIGLDLSDATIRIAQAATNATDEIEYQMADVFEFHRMVPVDFVVSSLLTHHMPDGAIVKFLRWMEATARKGWLICDLQRHAVPYYFIGLVGKLTNLHPMVIQDGRISVARSLTRAEWNERIKEAGIAREVLALRWFMFRLTVGRLR